MSQALKLCVVGLMAGLAACQTVPSRPGFSKRQVATLTEHGFKPVDGNYELGISDKVLFAFDRSELSPDTSLVVDHLAKVLLGVGIHGATVEGHTDSTGADAYNLDLSQRRATAVKGALAGSGLPESEIRAQGLGESDPIESNETEEGRAQNRRVVIVITPSDAMRVRR